MIMAESSLIALFEDWKRQFEFLKVRRGEMRSEDHRLLFGVLAKLLAARGGSTEMLADLKSTIRKSM